jgi:predicted Zn-dependent peptidase
MRGWMVYAVVLLLTAAPSAQQSLDRKKVPAAGKTPDLRVPAWTKTTLANGAELLVSEKHDLPLIAFSITFLGGADQFEPAGKQSVASLTAALLGEGTKTRDAEALSNALQLLGTSVNASVGGESGGISFRSTTAKFPATLDILADMLVNPIFPEGGLERLRGQRLVQLTQARAQPGAIANRVFPRIVYGNEHPYGRVVTEDTLKGVTRADIVAFHKAYYQPGRALVTVVGDTTTAADTMLGGMFQSRLNANIREEKGYSYGVSSNFGYGKGPGPFRTGGDIVTEKSDVALVEFIKELKGILGARPITDDELSVAKDALIQRLPGTFASVNSIMGALTSLWVQNLPDDYYQQYAKRIAAVTKDDVLRVAKQYVTVDKLAIVIVGDRKVIEAPLKATGIAPIVMYDIEGNPATK